MLQRWPQRVGAAALVLFAFAAAGGRPALAEAKDGGRVALTKDHVVRFLNTYPKVRAVGRDRARETGREISKVDDPLSTLVRLASDDTLRADVEVIVKENGFADLQEWAKISQNIALAYAAVKKPADPKIAEGVEKAISQIKKNKFIPEDRKPKLIEDIRKGAEKSGVLNQPKENVDLVRQMKGDIDAVITANK